MHPKNCPKCGTEWEQKENIYDYFRSQGDSKEEATKSAAMYGCTKDTPKHFGKDVVGVEVNGYDGVSFWQCRKCGASFNRWTMKEEQIRDLV